MLDELADELGMTEQEAIDYAKSLGLGDRKEPDFYIPTPEEIRKATEEIRRGWSPEELESRLGNVAFARMSTEAHNHALGSQAHCGREGCPPDP